MAGKGREGSISFYLSSSGWTECSDSLSLSLFPCYLKIVLSLMFLKDEKESNNEEINGR